MKIRGRAPKKNQRLTDENREFIECCKKLPDLIYFNGWAKDLRWKFKIIKCDGYRFKINLIFIKIKLSKIIILSLIMFFMKDWLWCLVLK